MPEYKIKVLVELGVTVQSANYRHACDVAAEFGSHAFGAAEDHARADLSSVKLVTGGVSLEADAEGMTEDEIAAAEAASRCQHCGWTMKDHTNDGWKAIVQSTDPNRQAVNDAREGYAHTLMSCPRHGSPLPTEVPK